MTISFKNFRKKLKRNIQCIVLFLLAFFTILLLNDKSSVNDELYKPSEELISESAEDQSLVGAHETADISTKKVEYKPGNRTVKNFLSAALSRVGTALYVFGGGWGEESHKIGPNKKMEDFLKSQNSSYLYLDTKKGKLPSNFDCSEASKIGKEKFLQSIGIDCAGFVGWAIYNTLHDKSDMRTINIVGKKEGTYLTSPEATYVCDFMRGDLEKRSILKFSKMNSTSKITPGDILSGINHIWIVIGICSDKSMLVVHSSSVDIQENEGKGGIMISGTETPSGHRESEALKLATVYMSRYFPEYHEKFKNCSAKENVNWKPDINIYCPFYSKAKKYVVPSLEGEKYIGKWMVLSDNENIRSKSCDEILKLLFEE